MVERALDDYGFGHWKRVRQSEWRNEPVQHVLRDFFRLGLQKHMRCVREDAEVCWQPVYSFSVSPVSTKSLRKGNWSTTMTDTSTQREISRTVPARMASTTVKLCWPSAPVSWPTHTPHGSGWRSGRHTVLA